MQTEASRPQPAFALAGEIVKTKAHALRILSRAVRERQEWLIPQARNVAIKLGRAAEAASAA